MTTFTQEEIEEAFDRIILSSNNKSVLALAVPTVASTRSHVVDDDQVTIEDPNTFTTTMNAAATTTTTTTTTTTMVSAPQQFQTSESASATPLRHVSSSSSSSPMKMINALHIQAYLWNRVLELEQEGIIQRSQQQHFEGNSHAPTTSTTTTTPAEDTPRVQQLRHAYCARETLRFLQVFAHNNNNNNNLSMSISKDQFVQTISTRSSQIDIQHTWPITVSMLLVGASVGVLQPAMPFVVESLQLSTGQYGAVVSAFALAKMAFNVPSAIAVERYGRKPFMTNSLVLIAAGVGGIGLATSFSELYLCRLCTGLGVAALGTAATMMITDLSTPRSRASTLAPIMSAFSAGTALGPALGGYMVDHVGLNPTFYVVGLSYFGVAGLNYAILDETKTRPMTFPWQDQIADTNSVSPKRSWSQEIQKAVGQWVPLFQTPTVRNILIMNAFYWVALAGSQMTLLPLILTDTNGLAMSATEVGSVYMAMSTVHIIGNPVFARLADRLGKAPAISGGCALISAAMATLPFCDTLPLLAGSLGMWSVGSSMLSTAPIAFISDKVDERQRAQAIALLRTCGDVGFLIGASGTGALADWAGSLDFAMQSSAGLLLTATVWFTVRQILSTKLAAADDGTSKQS